MPPLTPDRRSLAITIRPGLTGFTDSICTLPLPLSWTSTSLPRIFARPASIRWFHMMRSVRAGAPQRSWGSATGSASAPVWWQTHASSPTTDPTNSAEELSQFRYRAVGSSELCATHSALQSEKRGRRLWNSSCFNPLWRVSFGPDFSDKLFPVGVVFLDQRRRAILGLLQAPRWPVS